MGKKITPFKTTGMNSDYSVSAFKPEFSFENINLRLSTNEGNTMLSWVNERGPLQLSTVNVEYWSKGGVDVYEDPHDESWTHHAAGTETVSIQGTPIGTAVLNRTLVLFTHKEIAGTPPVLTDYIYKLEYKENTNKETMSCVKLFEGNLNFSTDYPIETMVSYEADHIQKVYWVDGRNQPRIINIADANLDKLAAWETAAEGTLATFFDFVPTTGLEEEVTVTRVKTGGEMFAPGTIQYCFTYFNKYGQQTNIAWTSTLYYLTHSDRGASPEDGVVNAFNIKINNPDENFDYIRLYSIQRTSIDDVPIVRLLDDLLIADAQEDNITGKKYLEYTDIGTAGASMDPTELLYVGGRDIIANTIADKDDTLFIGNFKQKSASLNDLQDYFNEQQLDITFANDEKVIPYGHLYENDGTYHNDIYINSYTLTLGSKRDITTFKGGETYRFGFQLQKNTGEWTEAIFINDKENDVYPTTFIDSGTVKARLVHAETDLDLSAIDNVLNGRLRSDYKKIRPVVVYPTVGERTVLCQGVVNPTLFNITDRVDHSPFAQSSWYFRPYMISLEKEGGSKSSILDVEFVKDGTMESVTTFNEENPAFPGSESLPYTTNDYYAVICNIPDSYKDEVLKRGYLVFRQIIYGEFRYDDGEVVVDTSPIETGDRSKYENAPWDKKLYFYGALPIGNGYLEDTSTFGGDAYLLLLNSPFVLPYDTTITTPNQEREGRPGTMFEKYAIEYQSPQVGFMKLPTEESINNKFTLYGELKKENGMLYYLNPTGDPQYNDYAFQIYYEYEDDSKTLQFTMHSSAGGYIVITNNKDGNGVAYMHYGSLPTQEGINGIKVTDINKRTDIEIQGSLSICASPFSVTPGVDATRSNSQFFVDQSIVTMHSPDIEFDTEVQNYDTESLKMRIVGIVPITSNVSAHRISTSTAMLENSHNVDINIGFSKYFGVGELGKNVVHNNIDANAGQRLVADYLWNDSFVLYDPSQEDKVITGEFSNDFMVFPWQRQGSLNNDPRSGEEASSWLKTKRESNLLYSLYSNYFDDIITNNGATKSVYDFPNTSSQMHLTENDFVMTMKLPRQKSTASEVIYYPNIDKVLYNSSSTGYASIYRYSSEKNPTPSEGQSIPMLNSPVHMRYKSTSHAVIAFNAPIPADDNSRIPILPYGKYTDEGLKDIGKFSKSQGVPDSTVWGDDNMVFSQNGIDETGLFLSDTEHNFLWLAELYKTVENKFANSANRWLPCGEAVEISDNQTMDLKWTDGDTYYQRYDNLKTYAFTQEDQNQLVEILSFMCETRVNIDGRYDRNRGQMDNTLMRPGIFNIINPVYSQRDNFFTAMGVSTDSRDTLTYPNMVTYSKTKITGADVDMWTNTTLASVLELDGDKGQLNKLAKMSNQLIAFQDTGISQILYNENVQIASTEGVPIELANSGKVNGKRYIADTIGCTNKWSVVTTSYGTYFIDSRNKNIYLLSADLQLTNLSVSGGMNAWSKNKIPGPEAKWNPSSFLNFRAFNDKMNQDVLFVNNNTALAWSEKIGAFTSFYDYGSTPYYNTLGDTGVWVRSNGTLWKHNAGDYCNFFGVNKPYSMTLVGNPEPQGDCIFTNLEFRASVKNEGSLSNGTYTPYLPFDSLEAWNEYQHGITTLNNRSGSLANQHFTSDGISALKRKFRMWRCDIPRDNAAVDSSVAAPFSTDAVLGIKRFAAHPVDRMRNPWVYLKLRKGAAAQNTTLPKTEIHDIILTYFS